MSKQALSTPISPIGTDFREYLELRRRDPEYAAAEAELAPLEALARILIAYRIEQRLTQKALAQRVGTSETAICRLESGQHKPSVETLVKIGVRSVRSWSSASRMRRAAGTSRPFRSSSWT
jgi:DNA-binding XRE family transcriptional regulator